MPNLIKKSDVKVYIMMPNLTFIRLKNGMRIYNARNRKNLLLIDKDGKRRYLTKITKKQQEQNFIILGKVAESIGRTIKYD